MKNKKIVIAGGTGFIGQALAAWFGKDNQIIIISRQSVNGHNNNYTQQLLHPSQGYNITYRRWDGEHQEKHWTNELENADIVINLAGKSVNCRYTEKNKKEIFDSRINATKAIGDAIRNCTVPPKLWINAGSATIYRHAADHPQDEYNGEFQDDFSVQVCKRWEETCNSQRTPFTRKLILRMAITLGNGGVTDLEGVYNCAAPNPVTNDFFMKTLSRLTGNKIGLPVYTWMLATGARLIGTEKELLLKSRWVVPTKLLETGYVFKFANLYDAVKEIVNKTSWKKYRLFKLHVAKKEDTVSPLKTQ